MNPGGLVATLALSGLALGIRRAGAGGGRAWSPTTRRGLGLLALLLPIAGVVLPFVPWRTMAILILLLTAGGLLALLPLDERASGSTDDVPHPDHPTS